MSAGNLIKLNKRLIHTVLLPHCVYPVWRNADVSRWSEVEIAYCFPTVCSFGLLKPSKLNCQRIGSWVLELGLWFIATTKKLINKVTEGRIEWSRSFVYPSYPLSQNKKYWEKLNLVISEKDMFVLGLSI